MDKEIETVVETTEEQEVIETQTESNPEVVETAEEIDFEQFKSVGTKEEIQDFLSDIIGEETSPETKKAINKLMAKIEKSSKEDEEKEIQLKELIEINKTEVMSNLPIKEKEFIELKKWVENQPVEYQEKLEKLTNYSNNTSEQIKEAILNAHKDRLNSVAGVAGLDNQTSGFETLTKEDVMNKFKSIHLTHKGQERIAKINDLKKSALSNAKLKEWAEIYFN